jgi:hypothetical protein
VLPTAILATPLVNLKFVNTEITITVGEGYLDPGLEQLQKWDRVKQLI